MERFIDTNERNLIELMYLLVAESDYVEIAELTQTLKISRNTVMSSLKKLEDYFPEGAIQYERSRGVRMSMANAAARVEQVHIKLLKGTFFFRFLYGRAIGAIDSSQSLQELLFISRSHVYQRLDKIKKELKPYHLYLDARDMSIHGRESWVRTFYQYMFYCVRIKDDYTGVCDPSIAELQERDVLLRHIARKKGLPYKDGKAIAHLVEQTLEQVVDRLSKIRRVYFSPSQREKLLYGLYVTGVRIKRKHPIHLADSIQLEVYDDQLSETAEIFTLLEDLFDCPFDKQERFYVLQLSKMFIGYYTDDEVISRRIAFGRKHLNDVYRMTDRICTTLFAGREISDALRDKTFVNIMDIYSLLGTFEYLPGKLLNGSLFPGQKYKSHISLRVSTIIEEIRYHQPGVCDENLEVIKRFLNNVDQMITVEQWSLKTSKIRIKIDLIAGYFKEVMLKNQICNLFGELAEVWVSGDRIPKEQDFDFVIMDYVYQMQKNEVYLYWVGDEEKCWQRFFDQVRKIQQKQNMNFFESDIKFQNARHGHEKNTLRYK